MKIYKMGGFPAFVFTHPVRLQEHPPISQFLLMLFIILGKIFFNILCI